MHEDAAGWQVEESVNPKVVTFRDLLVWQKSMDLVELVYRATKDLPDLERFGLCSQMQRCAVSIPSNIAEGYGRRLTGDYCRFLHISQGSLCELQTQMEIAGRLGFLCADSSADLLNRANEIERMLASLIRKLKIT